MRARSRGFININNTSFSIVRLFWQLIAQKTPLNFFIFSRLAASSKSKFDSGIIIELFLVLNLFRTTKAGFPEDLDLFPFFLIPCPVAFFNAIPAAFPTAPNAAAFATAVAAAAINAGIAARSGNIPPDLAMSLITAAER